MYLVTEGRCKINQLGYAAKSKEYVYFHKGKEMWRMVGDRSLLDYFNEVRAYGLFDENKVKDNPVWICYSKSCQELN